MLDSTTKRRIDNLRDILVGKVPDPKSQVEQITIALIYKFMDDMDTDSVEMGGKKTFFAGKYAKYSWSNVFNPKLGGFELINMYGEAITTMNQNPNIPQLFRDIFKNAYLPYRDPETLKSFLKDINEFTYDHSEKLGDAFEYLLSVLGSQGDAGQFRTPRHIIDFIVEILEPKKNETILDPACGTAGFLISSYKHILKTHSPVAKGEAAVSPSPSGKAGVGPLTPAEKKRLMQNFCGYDISPDMVRLSLVNLYLHGFPDPKIFEYDTLTSEERWNEKYDVILANPPFMTPKGGIKPHKKFSVQANRSEVLFVDYIAEHLNINGRAGIIVPEGVIFQSGNAYKALRKMLVENYLYAVVSLPAGIFQPYSGVKTSILIMDKSLSKKTDKILFVKIESDGFDLGAQRRIIEKNDLAGCLLLLQQYKQALQSNTNYLSDNMNVFLVEKGKIARDADFNLSIDRYRLNENIQQSNFEMVKLGAVCEIINGRAYKQEELLDAGKYPVLRVGNFFSNRSWYYSDLELEENKYCVKGDLLYAWSASFGPKIWDGEKSIYHYHIWKMNIDESRIDKMFLFYVLDSETESIKADGGRGIAMIHITKGGMEQREIPLPPISIQKQIVAKIESCQKIMDGAKQVTENYKPQIEIDPSWEMVRLEEVFKLSSGKGLTQQNIIEGDFPVYGGNGINGHHKEYFIEEQTIVIGRVGEYCGAIHLTEPKSWVTDNGLYVVKYFRKVNQIYLSLILESLNLNQYAKVGGQPSISQSTVYEVSVPLPPLSAQQEIVTRIKLEQQLVNSNMQLISIFEQKIKDEIGKLWQSAPKEYPAAEQKLSLAAEE